MPRVPVRQALPVWTWPAWGVQTLLIYLFLMWGGRRFPSLRQVVSRVNAFAVVVLNLVAVLRGTERVEVFGRELSHDSIRRSNATVVMSFGVLLLFIFIISILEPGYVAFWPLPSSVCRH